VTLGQIRDDKSDTGAVLNCEGRSFTARYNHIKTDDNDFALVVTTETTEAEQLRRNLDDSELVVMYIYIDNLTEMIPSEEELSANHGKTIGELLDNGWRFWSCNTEDRECGLYHGLFSYAVSYDGTIPAGTEIDENSVRDLTVVSVRYDGLGNISADLEEE
jgi:hypothetical protein